VRVSKSFRRRKDSRGRGVVPGVIAPVDGPLVFLAGPIQGAPHWQAEAINWFAEHALALAVASPHRPDRSRGFDYAAQVV
jgi:hypothetical protein